MSRVSQGRETAARRRIAHRKYNALAAKQACFVPQICADVLPDKQEQARGLVPKTPRLSFPLTDTQGTLF
mgnify:CR=1 FL=1